MPQSLAKIYVHIVFTTKNGIPTINESIRKDLQAYIIGTLAKLGSYTYEIYANPDHAHILCTLPRTMPLANLVSKIKTPSSKWIKTKGISNFDWQDGYSGFSVSASKIDVVVKYIQNQQEHHKKVNYKDELREFFREYGIDFNEKYVWD